MHENSMALAGKVAIVTGAASGIGEATAEVLVAAGASVTITSRRGDKLEAIQKRLGERVFAVVADVQVLLTVI